MRKILILIQLSFVWYSSLAFAESLQPAETAVIKAVEPFKKGERVLILAPHPDDETIGCAGIIQQALSQGAKVRVAYLTNGDHNQIAFIVYEKRLTLKMGEFIHMGEVRRQEAINAMKLLGVGEKDLIFLGYPDFGTFAMFSQYWNCKNPFKSLLTRISSVPYKENLSFGASYKPENILSDIKKVLLDYRPDKIFVSHPADRNVDHKTYYLFLQVALSDLSKEMPAPKVYPYLIHSVGWPIPRHYHPELGLTPPAQLPDSQISWVKFDLTRQQLNEKYQAILCYKSQTQSSAFYLLSFARKNELFGDYTEIVLERQISLKERAISFFGFSDMYSDSEVGTLGGLEDLKVEKGNVSYAVVDDTFLIRIEKAKDIESKFGFMLYIFGYNGKTPFGDMPKLRIIARHDRLKVFDGKKMTNPQGIAMQLNSNDLILKIPLKVLGSPEFILASMRAYAGILPVDVTGFRKIVIK